MAWAPREAKTALLLVDFQEAFRVPGHFGRDRSSETFAENVGGILRQARAYNVGSEHSKIEIIHVHHHSSSQNSPLCPTFVLPSSLLSEKELSRKAVIHGIDPAWYARPVPGERTFTKNVNSAFIGTGLEAYLRDLQIRQLFICGLTTEHCVSTTVRMAANLKVLDDLGTSENGKIFLIEDACAAYNKDDISAEMVHRVHVESLKDEFAGIITASEIRELFVVV